MKEVIGIPSGDHELETFDVPFDYFVEIEGRVPDKYDKSCFYVGLYRSYSIPTCKALREAKGDKLIKVEYDDFGIRSIMDTDIPTKYIYNGYEEDEWFN